MLVQVALAMTVLGGFCAMSIDYGLLMVARGQAQTAADSGALAGAIALGFDDTFNTSSVVKQSARNVASRNLVAQQSADVTDADVQLNQCSVTGFPPPKLQSTMLNCVAVSAYRNSARGNALPTFFGQLVGIGNQGVRATATAMIVPSNASDCVWPLAIPEGWQELAGAALTFDRYDVTGTLLTPRDVYVPPTFAPPSLPVPGTGYTLPPFQPSLPVQFNKPLTLTNPWPSGPMIFNRPELGRFVPVQIPRRDGGGFGDSLASCNNSDQPVTIGDRLNVEPTGTLAAALAGASGRLAADHPTETLWNTTTFRVEGSCAADATPCAPMSPRLVVLPVFDLNRYEDARALGSTPVIEIVNFVGFFITRVTGTSIEGQITMAPGRVVMGKPMVGYDSAFVRTPILTR